MEEVVKGPENVKYIYDAAGRKLAQEVYNSSGTLVKTTDYIGELMFENNVMKMITHNAGRVLPDGAGWEYQYHLTDHLGNVRVTFTAKAQTTTTVSTNFESTTSSDFLNYSSQINNLNDHTDAGLVYTRVQTLNGGVNGRVGIAKTYDVLPGDEISVSSWVKYGSMGGNNANGFLIQLAAAFGVSSSSVGEGAKIYNGLSAFDGNFTRAGGNSTTPRAFATIIFFDKDYNFIDAGFAPVPSDGTSNHVFVSFTKKAPVEGYAYVFLSNEDAKYVDVYFDDVSMSHTPSPIVSVSDYFPFGLSHHAMERGGSTEQKLLYNSKELQDELSVNWYDYGARMYMPEIGRWGVIDPMAGQARRWTPYRYGFDNPLRFIDPDGMFEYSNGYYMEESTTSCGSVSYEGWYRDPRAEKRAFAAQCQSRVDAVQSMIDNLYASAGDVIGEDFGDDVFEDDQETPISVQFLEFLNFFYGQEAAKIKKKISLTWVIGGTLARNADGNTQINDDGSLTIQISQKALMDPKLLYITIAHELVHASDFINGNLDKWTKAVLGGVLIGDERRILLAEILEYHAYQRDAQIEAASGWDYGGTKARDALRRSLKLYSELTDENYIDWVDK